MLLQPLAIMNLFRPRLFIAALVAACLLSFSSCESKTDAKLEGGNPPVFSIGSGTGRLWFFHVSEYRDDKSLKPSERSREVWSVQAGRDSSGNDLGKYTSEIGKITYGIVPEGYTQVYPATGIAPPLIEGRYYVYLFKTENGMPAVGEFEIRGGQAVTIKIPHDCYYVENGKEIEAPCYDDTRDPLPAT